MTKITERGMIFNAEMVRAILDGRKTQTRRVMKPQPGPCPRGGHWWPSNVFKTMLHVEEEMQNSKGGWGGLVGDACPFGDVGDRIWMRETWATLGNEDGCYVDWEGNLCKGDERSAARIYRASCEQRPGDYGLWSIPDDAYWKPHTKEHKFEGAWRPSIHMPRWASRILLEITDVRVERLNAISQEDAQAEGMELTGWRPTYSDPDSGGEVMTPYDNFAELWSSIYGDESWKANPWVWVISFKRVEGGAA
ncbi:TPA: hypothetical protein ACXGB2_004946 [Klebsiella pneumoniae]|uniref:hypothetical protein n=1 Tax=Klebsiella pneumoniae TaxID=573 RepID=UPI00195526CB|nr:hypothetical protein [Klebsiella pneumoniae]MEB2885383.1 hypothetical protein [Klebsiella pneumoniae]HCF6560055.1 hypothetical protein [Klebsiella pneumoniae]HCF6570976.1 hypothetical protein [Klebsiella pneumoniae]HCF6576398.1 hypothetical protein [Klebsiella pneumoniae]HCF8709625.1 hypothetical protein [Klebsiella pneumoniae]